MMKALSKKKFIVLMLISMILFNPALATGTKAEVLYTELTLGNMGWSDPTVGIWDPLTLTGTLTQDVYGSIRITSNYITLDGNGHLISGNGTGNGVERTYGSVTIRNLRIDNYENGLYLNGLPMEFLVENNTITNTTRGIYLYKCAYGKVSNNSVSTSEYYGIIIAFSNEILIESNHVFNNHIGLTIAGGMYNTIRFNEIGEGNTTGLILSRNWDGLGWGIPAYNSIYHNNFIRNITHIRVSYGVDNLFNLESPDGGNYWTGHYSLDGNADGIADTPFTFQDGHDYRPWMQPSGWLNIPVDPPEEPYLIAIDHLIETFDEAVLDLTLMGNGNAEKLVSLRAKLVEVKAKLLAEELRAATQLLKVIEAFVDGQPKPKDFVIGEASEDIRQLICDLLALIEP
jgi:parallel beta-helix repeat protein